MGAAFSVPELDDDLRSDDPAGEIEEKRANALRSLGELSETLFALRESITLPGTEAPRKRRRTEDGDAIDEKYWEASAADSFALADA